MLEKGVTSGWNSMTGGQQLVPYGIPHSIPRISLHFQNYCQTSGIRYTKSQNLNVSHLILQLSLPNPLKPGVKSRMKMWLEQCRQAMLQLHLSDQQFYCQGAPYIQGLTVGHCDREMPYGIINLYQHWIRTSGNGLSSICYLAIS